MFGRSTATEALIVLVALVSGVGAYECLPTIERRLVTIKTLNLSSSSFRLTMRKGFRNVVNVISLAQGTVRSIIRRLIFAPVLPKNLLSRKSSNA